MFGKKLLRSSSFSCPVCNIKFGSNLGPAEYIIQKLSSISFERGMPHLSRKFEKSTVQFQSICYAVDMNPADSKWLIECSESLGAAHITIRSET